MSTIRTRAAKGSELTHGELDANFVRDVDVKTTTYAALVSDNRTTLECNHATTPFTVTLGDAATMAAAETGDYEITISNIGAAAVTVARAGSDTIDGAATSIVLAQYSSVTLKVNAATNGYNSIAGRRNITATDAEINILDGVTSTTAELNILDGVTSTAAELNILDGVTSTAAELNILDGVTATATELNYVDGVTSAIQTQLDQKGTTAGTAIATTSGTSHTFSGIPSWVKKITLMIGGVSTNGTSNLLIQIGDSGGIETSAYFYAYGFIADTGTADTVADTTGIVVPINSATGELYGSIVLTLLDSNLWTISGNVYDDSPSVEIFHSLAGAKTLSATLDRLQVSTVNGTDTFDAGSINILYE